jgi:catechol-2,3-dioxygenase
VAFKIGDHLDDLRAARAHLEAHGVRLLGAADHRVSQSLYVADPDGHVIELFVDGDPAVWRAQPSIVATVEPLDL